ncbi:uncharacterized protein LOC125485089 isoform X1 [Rhincodon typus]|uniref:uncharacterized protein LOC125485089 isoform X1 n=2 Tax=Rhincodon typus TaxID=259920 RepID=UPI00202EDE9B|nr:uncharacterized protein LOC125485089 isoform X1 [Rhincodon typus]
MSRYCNSCCCCCCPWRPEHPDTEAEQEPLMIPQSARQLRRPTEVMSIKDGRISAKIVNVAELDHCFANIVDTFNHQHSNYITLCEFTRLLKECCQCNTLMDCFRTLQHEHRDFTIKLDMQGYNFSLSVQPKQSIPKQLLLAQQYTKELCTSTKSILAADPKLQEMINSMLQTEDKHLEMVKHVNESYQERTRCLSNAKDNFIELRRAKQFSNVHKELADRVLKDIVGLVGINV